MVELSILYQGILFGIQNRGGGAAKYHGGIAQSAEKNMGANLNLKNTPPPHIRRQNRE